MRGLLGDRFLRWFAGDLKGRRKQPPSKLKDQNPAADVDMAVGPDNPAFKEGCADKMSEGNDLQNEEKQNLKGKAK